MNGILNNIALFFPEILLSILAAVVFSLGFWGEKGNYRIVMRLGVLSLVAAGFVLFKQDVDAVMMFSKYMKIVIICVASIFLLMATEYLEFHKIDNPNYPVLIIFSVLGMLISMSVENLLLVFAGLEMQTLSLYGVMEMQHKRLHLREEGKKYFFLSVASAILFLYGVSLVYRHTGSFSLFAVASSSVYATSLLIAAVVFKVTVMPFKIMTSSPVSAFFSVVPKLAALVVVLSIISPAVPFSREIATVVSIALMVFGSVASLRQKKLRNLFAHTSIYHFGYALMCFVILSMDSVKYFIAYIMVYIILAIGGFSFTLLMQRKGKTAEEISTLEGLSNEQSGLALSVSLILVSSALLPVIAMFITKFHIFKEILRQGYGDLAVVGFFSSLMVAYCFLRVVRKIYHCKPAHLIDKPDSKFLMFLVNFSIVLTVVLSVFPDLLSSFYEGLF